MSKKEKRIKNINDALQNIEHDLIFEFRFLADGIVTYQSVIPYSFTKNKDIVYVSIEMKYKKGFALFKFMELTEFEDDLDVISISEVYNSTKNTINK